MGLRGAGEAQEAVTYGRLRPRQAVGPAALGTPTPAPTAPERRRTVWGSLPVPPVSDRPRVGETNAKAEAVNAEAPFAPSAPPASGQVGLCAPPRGAGAVPSLGGETEPERPRGDSKGRTPHGWGQTGPARGADRDLGLVHVPTSLLTQVTFGGLPPPASVCRRKRGGRAVP